MKHPLATTKYKREAFSRASSKAMDVIVGMLLRLIFDVKFRKESWAHPPIFIFVEEDHRFAAPRAPHLRCQVP